MLAGGSGGMRIKILENFEGEEKEPCACMVDFVVPPTEEDMVGWSTFDPRRLWTLMRAIKRRHPELFRKNTIDPSKFITLGLVKRRYFEEYPETLMLVVHFRGEMFCIAPVISNLYEPVFPNPKGCTEEQE